ncbi:MAG: acetolactate synthase small subunit [bacterium]
MRKMHTILVFAQNKRGVLERLTMVIRKKMYNLEQITASDTEKDGIKRLTISFSHEESQKIPQIISQIKNVVEVIDAHLVEPENTILREVGLFKIERPNHLSEVLSLTDIFKAEVIYTSEKYLIIELVGSPAKIHDFANLLKEFKILEMGTSGGVAMEK